MEIEVPSELQQIGHGRNVFELVVTLEETGGLERLATPGSAGDALYFRFSLLNGRVVVKMPPFDALDAPALGPGAGASVRLRSSARELRRRFEYAPQAEVCLVTDCYMVGEGELGLAGLAPAEASAAPAAREVAATVALVHPRDGAPPAPGAPPAAPPAR